MKYIQLNFFNSIDKIVVKIKHLGMTVWMKMSAVVVISASIIAIITYSLAATAAKTELQTQHQTGVELHQVLQDLQVEAESEVVIQNDVDAGWNLWHIKTKTSEIVNQNEAIKKELRAIVEQKKSEIIVAQNQLTELSQVAIEMGLEVNLKCEKCQDLAANEITLEAKKIVMAELELQQKTQELRQQISTKILAFQQKNTYKNPLWGKTDTELQSIITAMNVRQKAGQLLMFGFSGTVMTETLQAELENWQAGGVILMGSNVSEAKQTGTLIDAIQNTNLKIPYFVSVDQEGGVVARIPWDEVGGQANWSQKDEQTLCSYGTNRANLLRGLGFNLNFSPVTDLSHPGQAFINNRTISADSSVVAQKLPPYIRCHQNNGVFTTIKHFPGHGSTTEDSHFTLPTITKTEVDWREQDLIPFAQNLDSQFVMAGHLIYSAIDDKPATQSHKMLTEILRNQLKFDGLIITDDMNQLHVSSKIGVREALKNAYTAGVDVVLYVGLPKSQTEITNELVGLIDTGEVPSKTVDEILMRILRTKRRIGIVQQ